LRNKRRRTALTVFLDTVDDIATSTVRERRNVSNELMTAGAIKARELTLEFEVCTLSDAGSNELR
jgi:hypothetical protein